MSETKPSSDTAREARDLIRESTTAALGTLARGEEGSWPYASFVTVACDLDATPILLLSELAEHTKNIKADPKVSLLFTGAGGGGGDPLARGRISMLGEAARTDEPRHRERFLARHEAARGYADFRDFHFYKVVLARTHLVAGFGRIHWIEANSLLYGGDWAELGQAESEIIAHMNADHAQAVRLYAERLLGLPAPGNGAAWRMTGIDPEGCDLSAGDATARLAFEKAVSDAEGARAELVRLAKQAHGGG